MKAVFRFLISLPVLLLLMQGLAFAQGPQLRGKVTDADGKALAGVTVRKPFRKSPASWTGRPTASSSSTCATSAPSTTGT